MYFVVRLDVLLLTCICYFGTSCAAILIHKFLLLIKKKYRIFLLITFWSCWLKINLPLLNSLCTLVPSSTGSNYQHQTEFFFDGYYLFVGSPTERNQRKEGYGTQILCTWTLLMSLYMYNCLIFCNCGSFSLFDKGSNQISMFTKKNIFYGSMLMLYMSFSFAREIHQF